MPKGSKMLNNIRTLIILNKQEFCNAKVKNPDLRSMRGEVMSYYKRQLQNKLERILCGVVNTLVSSKKRLSSLS